MEENNTIKITKDEMLQYINNKIEKNNISDDISAYIVFIEDNKSDSTCMIGKCSEVSLLAFIARGIINLAEYKNINLFNVAMDALDIAIKINEFEQQKKEQEQEGV